MTQKEVNQKLGEQQKLLEAGASETCQGGNEKLAR
jgi:hypothetical protein